MTTFFKKSIIFAVLLAAVTFAASAFDGSIEYCIDLGTYSRADFKAEGNSDSFANDMYGLLSDYFANQGGTIDTFFAITPQNLDAEDRDLLDGTDAYLRQNYKIKTGSTYMTTIVRGATDTGADGWCVTTNLDKNSSTSFIFYFNVAF
jgi:hypothetical protein